MSQGPVPISHWSNFPCNNRGLDRHMELQEDEALQVLGCRGTWGPSLWLGQWEMAFWPAGRLFSLRICVTKYMSCGTRSADCTTSELTRKRSTRSSLRPCGFESLNLQFSRGTASLCIRLKSGNSHDGEGWKLVTSGPGGKAPAPHADL